MTVIHGVLTEPGGNILPSTTITLSEVDSGQQIITTTTSDGRYSLTVQPGTYRVTLQAANTTPKQAGVVNITPHTPDGSLKEIITHITGESLDISVLGFLRGLIDEAERATEVLNTAREATEQSTGEMKAAEASAKASAEVATQAAAEAKQAAADTASQVVGFVVQQTFDQASALIKGEMDRAEAAANNAKASETSAQQLLEQARQAAIDKGIQGEPGKSAFDIWAEQQPAGSDTSMAAYLKFQEGKPGDPGKDGESAYEIWASQQPPGADTSMHAFMDLFRPAAGSSGETYPVGSYALTGGGAAIQNPYTGELEELPGTWEIRGEALLTDDVFFDPDTQIGSPLKAIKKSLALMKRIY
ncbi:carboxypeptidase regulatory-like domain-containing protein [Salmonella enterica]